MKPKPSASASYKDMPTVVVLIPGTGDEQRSPRSASASPSKQRLQSLHHKPHSAPSSSSSSAAASSSLSKLPTTSTPSKHHPKSQSKFKPETSDSSASVLLTLPVPPTSFRRPLLSSSSLSSLSSSPLSRQPSSSSSSSASSSRAPSSSGHRSRNNYHDQPIDITNPFGDDPFSSSKRTAPLGQGLYVCRWRLKDKKGILDLLGHQFCHAQLMTPDLLARHVLTEHVASPTPQPTHDAHEKIACKWNSCFNRHYDPEDLAGHLVHDHFTHQMGLKYACIAAQCSHKSVITSYEALARHHAQYHGDVMLAGFTRKRWQLKRVHKDPEQAAILLATLKKLDSAPRNFPEISVSADANPKYKPLDARARTKRDIELKRKLFDPFNIQPGDGQEGQPWIRLHKRLQKCVEFQKEWQAAHDAIFRATEYNQHDLDRLPHACVEVAGDATTRLLDYGLHTAQLYHAREASSSRLSVSRGALSLSVPPQEHCEVELQSRPQGLVESIASTSLLSIEKEMKFDTSLAKQRRWVDKVLLGTSASPRHGTRPSISAQTQLTGLGSDSDESNDEWVPPLRLNPYHPSARSRFAIIEDSSTEQKPRAIRGRTGATPLGDLPSGETSVLQSRSSSPGQRSRSSSLTHAYEPNLFGTKLLPSAVKREREEEGDDDATLLNGVAEPPSSKIKLEDCIDLTGFSSDDDDDMGAPPAKQEQMSLSSSTKAVFVELAPNNHTRNSPGLGRDLPSGKQKHRLSAASSRASSKDARRRRSSSHRSSSIDHRMPN